MSIAASQQSFLINALITTHKPRTKIVTSVKVISCTNRQDDQKYSSRKNDNQLAKLAVVTLAAGVLTLGSVGDAAAAKSGGRVGGQAFRPSAPRSAPRSYSNSRTRVNIWIFKQNIQPPKALGFWERIKYLAPNYKKGRLTSNRHLSLSSVILALFPSRRHEQFYDDCHCWLGTGRKPAVSLKTIVNTEAKLKDFREWTNIYINPPVAPPLVGGYGYGSYYGGWGWSPFSVFVPGPSVAIGLGGGFDLLALFLFLGAAAAVVRKFFGSREDEEDY
ncbi:hypothetical protein WN943_002761 [Citrus x changshan-huyou]